MFKAIVATINFRVSGNFVMKARAESILCFVPEIEVGIRIVAIPDRCGQSSGWF